MAFANACNGLQKGLLAATLCCSGRGELAERQQKLNIMLSKLRKVCCVTR